MSEVLINTSIQHECLEAWRVLPLHWGRNVNHGSIQLLTNQDGSISKAAKTRQMGWELKTAEVLVFSALLQKRPNADETETG